MTDLNLDKYLSIVNKEKVKRGLETYIPLYPMLRIIDNELYVATLITAENDNVWETDGNVKAEYWALINPINDELIEFNKTSDKDFIIGSLIPKNTENKQKDMI